jgi:hypothetical protein
MNQPFVPPNDLSHTRGRQTFRERPKNSSGVEKKSGKRSSEHGCQIFLGTIYQNGKYIPNYHKIYQMSIKCGEKNFKIDRMAIK